MFNRLEIAVLPQGPRFASTLRLWVDGCEVVAVAVEEGGRGPFAADALRTDRPSPLAATSEARRVELGEPECTGGCCGYLSAIVERCGGLVVWSDWDGPYRDQLPLDFHFDAEQYDAELARVLADRWWEVYECPAQQGMRSWGVLG
ncbi:hypothetical protein ACFO9E_11600 [Streptomyces maoxianensis]|uniref:Uncharacterized protein n=1 Tax=Streptomyces maoxianensis TaxID=1459942 RepID=A0ABV9G321_9ACTN